MVRAGSTHDGVNAVKLSRCPYVCPESKAKAGEVVRRNGPKKLDSFSGVFKCSATSGYAALGSRFRL